MHKGQHPPHGEHFQEAIAQWQLELQTELKRASSLPTTMFDACDPMLEARLAETTESLFRCLLEQELPADRRQSTEPRLEMVSPQELSALLNAAAQGHYAAEPAPELEQHLSGEYFAILADTCCRSSGQTQQLAARQLRAASRLEARSVAGLAQEIARQVTANADPAAFDVRTLAATCHRVATLLAHDAGDADQRDRQ